MPIYEYNCNLCNESFSLLQPVNSNNYDIKCPNCSSKDVSKKISLFSCCMIGNSSGYDSSGLHVSHSTG